MLAKGSVENNVRDDSEAKGKKRIDKKG